MVTLTVETQAVYAVDKQLRQIYDLAEKNEVWNYDFYGFKFELPQERKFAETESIERYCRAVVELDPVQTAFPGAKPPTVRTRSNGAFAHYEPWKHQIAICVKRDQRWALRELVVLHELAHAMVPGEDHGPKWRGAYVFLVEQAMSPELGMVLGAMYHQELDAPHIPVL